MKSPLPIPDLSPITKSESTFSLKCHGSYKKPKILFPQSPMKSPGQKFFTPIRLEGKNLFGTEPPTVSDKDTFPFRKLNFDMGIQMSKQPKSKFTDLLDNVNEKEEELPQSSETKEESDLNNFQCNSFNLFPSENTNHFNRFDKEFIILKTLSENKFVTVHKCQHITTGKIFAVKKIFKGSYKNNMKTTQQLYNDINKCKFSIASHFCINYIDYWMEEEVFDIVQKSTHYTDKTLYILLDYFDNGDLLDYLSKLEQNNFEFTSDFYWDIIFEMLIGLNFFHEIGYLHLDIKPNHFLVDDEGYLKLCDFGLSHRIIDMKNLNDIYEGDSTYISPEMFNRHLPKDVDQKCDVYSLGLSILEIMAKIELPKNGVLWRQMRTYEMNKVPDEFLVNWNIKNIQPFINLIYRMIAPYNERDGILTILNDKNFPQLNKRLIMFMNNNYYKSTYIPNLPSMKMRKDSDTKMCIDSPSREY